MFIELAHFILAGCTFFLQIVRWAILIEIVLSWLSLIGITIILGPLVAITNPLYALVRRIIPTQIGMIDFAPFIILFGIHAITTIVIPAALSLIGTL